MSWKKATRFPFSAVTAFGNTIAAAMLRSVFLLVVVAVMSFPAAGQITIRR